MIGPMQAQVVDCFKNLDDIPSVHAARLRTIEGDKTPMALIPLLPNFQSARGSMAYIMFDGHISQGDVLLLDTSDCFAHSEEGNQL